MSYVDTVRSYPVAMGIERTDQLAFASGHYILTVASLLTDEAIPVFSPALEDLRDEPGEPAEIFGGMAFSSTFARRVGGDEVRDLRLDWDTVSGWHLRVGFRTSSSVTLHCWMSSGVAPSPVKVTSFVRFALIDIASAGSEEKPHYRSSGVDIDELVAGLETHLPASAEDLPPNLHLEHRFASRQELTLVRHLAEDLAEPDSVRLIGIRGGELEALLRIADWHHPYEQEDLGELIRLLTNDLRGRFRGAPGGTGERIGAKLIAGHDTATRKAKAIRSALSDD